MPDFGPPSAHYALCDRCKKSYDRGVYSGEFCNQCGDSLVEACPKCKANIVSKIAKRCPECGTPYFGTAPPE
jgi:hypothetical protein